MEWLTGDGARCSAVAGAEAGLLHEAGDGRGRGGSSDGGHGAHSHDTDSIDLCTFQTRDELA